MIRLGTRGSALATTQSGHIRDALINLGYECELTIIKTPGDQFSGPVERIGVGVFTQALREAMAENRCDIAVHSFKDLPTAPDPRFSLIVPTREDPREALIARDNMTLAELPPGAKIGTSAPRRIGQLRLMRPDLDIQPLRGNVDTRISHVRTGKLDAVILAAAGLNRLGRLEEATEIFEPTVFMPAPAQGALAVEGKEEYTEIITKLSDPTSTIRAHTERTILSVLEAGCTAPIAAHCTVEGEKLHLSAGIFGDNPVRVEGSTSIEGSTSYGLEEGIALARELAEELRS